jgi:hypothetical protein
MLSSLALLLMLGLGACNHNEGGNPPPNSLDSLSDSTHMYWYTDSTHGAGGTPQPQPGSLGINILGDGSGITLNTISGVDHVYVYDLGVYNPAAAPGAGTLVGTLTAPGDNVPLTLGNWYFAAPSQELYFSYCPATPPGTWELCSQNIFPAPIGSRSITVMITP